MDVSDVVQQEIKSRFSAADGATVLELFTATSLPFLDAPNRGRERDRVHLAILRLANGEAAAADRWLRQAARDWRDVLMSAGLANGDWSQTLVDAGFPRI
jgi:hypothetical protein